MPERLPRHTLVWLSAYAGWQADIAAHEPRLAAWFAQGLPAIVARRAADDADPRLRLGVPLPPPRANCAWPCACRHTMLRTAPPPALQAVLEGDLVQDWQRPCRHCRTSPRRAYSERSPGSTSLDCTMCTRARTSICCGGSTPPQADALAARLQAWETRYGRRVDGELCLADGAAVNWREYAGRSREVLVKRPAGAALELRESVFAPAGERMNAVAQPTARPAAAVDCARLGRLAVASLHAELALAPKPGLVTPFDRGSHHDMDARTFLRSLFALRHYFTAVARLGAAGADFEAMRRCGIAAEAAMLRATGGINTIVARSSVSACWWRPPRPAAPA